MQEGRWERARELDRALDASDAVDRDEFTALARGWAELTGAGEISGWTVLVRVDAPDHVAGDVARVRASVLEALVAQVAELDVIGVLDDRTLGILVDADEPGCRAMVASVARILDGSTAFARWQVVVGRTDGDDAIATAEGRLDRAEPSLGAVVAPWPAD